MPALEEPVGQERLGDPIASGLEASTDGSNIFATGPAGTGKRTVVQAHLQRLERWAAAAA
ncbi:MAG: hypothetical protein ACLP50_34525 [Solirubrobacteraceae bacterium]